MERGQIHTFGVRINQKRQDVIQIQVLPEVGTWRESVQDFGFYVGGQLGDNAAIIVVDVVW